MSAADTIGILGFALHAAHKLYDAIQLIRDAPEDMEALQIEVRRVRSILIQSIQMPDNASRVEREMAGSIYSLRADLIQQARQWMEGANRFVEKATKMKNDGSCKVDRLLWPLRAADAKKLTEESKRFYLAVSAVYSVDTSYVFGLSRRNSTNDLVLESVLLPLKKIPLLSTIVWRVWRVFKPSSFTI